MFPEKAIASKFRLRSDLTNTILALHNDGMMRSANCLYEVRDAGALLSMVN
ncbi:MAG: hypothetical protein AB4352_23370 [Hormoscilla sp.]